MTFSDLSDQVNELKVTIYLIYTYKTIRAVLTINSTIVNKNNGEIPVGCWILPKYSTGAKLCDLDKKSSMVIQSTRILCRK